MRHMTRVIGAIALTCLVAACQSEAQEGGGGGGAPPPPTVTVATPVVKMVREEDEYVGRFQAIDDVTLRARVSGYLDEIHFIDGQMVERGDLLFTIDQREFQAALDEADARLETARATLNFARTQYERGEELVERGTIPVVTFDERREALLGAQSELNAAEATRSSAALRLAFTEIRAPVAGRIDRNLISEGNLVRADDTALTSIVSLDPIEFYFDIDERALLNYQRDARSRGVPLQLGAGALQVTVELADGEDGPFTGTLNFAENRVDQRSGSIRLRALFQNPEFILQPGLFGRVTVPGSLAYEAVMVPDRAVVTDQNRRLIYAVGGDNKVAFKTVDPGPTIDGYRVIRSGLDGNERVVLDGLVRLRPGMTVTPDETTLPDVADGAAG